MGLQVLLVGRLRPELGVSGTHEGVAVADVRRPEAVQGAVERLTGPEGSVLVVCAEADTAEVRSQLDLLSVALPRVTTLLEPVPGPPLAVGVVAALVNDLDGTRDPAAQLAMLDRLRERAWSAVWLPSVTKLDRPQPSVGQHARSWLGGAGFLAIHGSRPRVLTCTGTQVPPLDDVPSDGVLMAADNGSPSWVVPAVTGALRAHDRIDYTTWRDPRDAYGVAADAEFVLVPRDLDAADATPDDVHECPACGNRHNRRVCPYCRMVRATPEAEPQAEPEAEPEAETELANQTATQTAPTPPADQGPADDHLQGAPA